MRLTELGTRRFIGDTETMVVHDRWNSNSEGCLLELIIEKESARGFNPDQSDQAFWEDYEYCPHCFNRKDPRPPAWAPMPPPDDPYSPWDDVPPAWRSSPLIPRGPVLSAGGAVSMEDEASAEGETA